MDGVYKFCFSNEFSTFSHKTVYFSFSSGNDDMIEQIVESDERLTKMEQASVAIHKKLEQAADFQTHHRLRETQGRKRAEDINERVLWWSIIETFGILCITIGQVLILRNFFTDRSPNSGKTYARM